MVYCIRTRVGFTCNVVDQVSSPPPPGWGPWGEHICIDCLLSVNITNTREQIEQYLPFCHGILSCATA